MSILVHKQYFMAGESGASVGRQDQGGLEKRVPVQRQGVGTEAGEVYL